MKFGIIGAGHWGIAFAELAAAGGNEVLVWDRNPAIISELNSLHAQSHCFPNIKLNSNIIGTTDLSEIASCDIAVISIPFQALRSFLSALDKNTFSNTKFLVLSKGIEIGTNKLAHQIIQETLGSNKVAILSGPNFAHYIIQKLPAATVIACEDLTLAENLKTALTCDFFRCYTSQDVTGTELCGAVKNVIAIAAGICEGAKLGENAKAALITRSLVEIERLVTACGGEKETVYGLAGAGDLMLTCGSRTSRNFDYGYQIGANGSVPQDDSTKTIEGKHTAKALHSLALEKSIVNPISNEVYEILYNRKTVHDAIKSLMSRQ